MMHIGVIGPAQCPDEIARLAESVGKEIASCGALLVCGGLSGVMTAAAKGAYEAGGITVGILPGGNMDDANPYITIPIVTAMGHARNVVLVHSSHVLIAIEGGYGTLSEIAIALKLGKPVIGLHTWNVSSEILKVDTPAQAVQAALDACNRVR